ncbi:MAG: hypothetical protein IPM92_16065 [Saprospiraceae bacterium]|nr:hypothetical protein [Saprospiraceae bacterium]
MKIKLQILVVLCSIYSTANMAQLLDPLKMGDSVNINVYYITRGIQLDNQLDTLWLFNKPTFDKYNKAYKLLFTSSDSYENLIKQMETRDSLVNKLLEERKSAYDALFKLNQDFYNTSGNYIKSTQDSLIRMTGQLTTLSGQLNRANENLDQAIEYIKSAKKDRYKYLIIGFLAGGIIGYVLH